MAAQGGLLAGLGAGPGSAAGQGRGAEGRTRSARDLLLTLRRVHMLRDLAQAAHWPLSLGLLPAKWGPQWVVVEVQW